jgi:hypothetical protein
MEPINPYAAPQSGELVTQAEPPRVLLTLPDVLRAGTALYAEHFPAIALVTLIFWVPLEVAQAYLDWHVIEPDDAWSSFWLAMLIENVIGPIPTAGITAIGAAALRGERPTLGMAIIEGLAAWPRVFAARLIVSFVVLLGAFLCVIPGIYLAVRTLFAETVAVIERRDGLAAPGRSFELTERRFWHLLALVGTIAGFSFVAGMLMQLPTMFFEHWLASATLAIFIDLLAGWPVLLIVAAYWSIATAQPEPV